MRTRARPIAALLTVGLSGCVAHGTDADVRAVRTLVREQASIDFDLVTQSAALDDEDGSVDPTASELAEDSLTLDEAIRIALLNNRELRADLSGLGIARGELVQANVFPNPDVEFQVRFSEDDSQPPQWDFGVGIGLTDVILRRGRREVAEAELDAARIRVAAATLDLAYDVRLAYYDVQASQQDLELMRTVLASFVAAYDTARALHEAGNLSDLDLSTEQAAYEDARVAVALAEAELVGARERLNVLLGFFGRETSWEISTTLEAPPIDAIDLERLEARAIESSVELAHTRSTLIAAARRLGVERAAGLLPDIDVGVHAEYDGTFWEVGPSVTGRLPVFDRRQGAVVSRRAELDAMRERYVADAIRIRAAIRTARARAISARERVLHYRDTILPLRDRIVAQTLLQYNAMQVGVFQLLQARRDRVEAGRAYVATLRECWRARAALEQLLAGRLAGTISTATEPSSSPRVPTGRTDAGH